MSKEHALYDVTLRYRTGGRTYELTTQHYGESGKGAVARVVGELPPGCEAIKANARKARVMCDGWVREVAS